LGLLVAAPLVAALAAVLVWRPWERHLPGEQAARREFAAHTADYMRFVLLLRNAPLDQFVGSDGMARDTHGVSRFVPEYRELMRSTGAKSVLVKADGSIEFLLWGFGCTICSDSLEGLRYVPRQQAPHARHGWEAQSVESLEDRDLPHEHGSIADGLYVLQIAPEWFVYRFEYQE
jgi:hypothetical protein